MISSIICKHFHENKHVPMLFSLLYAKHFWTFAIGYLLINLKSWFLLFDTNKKNPQYICSNFRILCPGMCMLGFLDEIKLYTCLFKCSGKICRMSQLLFVKICLVMLDLNNICVHDHPTCVILDDYVIIYVAFNKNILNHVTL